VVWGLYRVSGITAITPGSSEPKQRNTHQRDA
jgi:hypothetical protein